ncbi:MAG: DUF2127 domain-containing protein [Gemmatimonadota bacterium]|nr:DUF2127 domain-containing protein [Gemmatimonadota bacterium]
MTRARRDRGLELIAAFKLFKALLLILAGAGALSLLRAETATEVREWLAELTVGRGQQLVERALGLLNVASPKRITELGIASIVYGLLFATEGIGLWMEKRWAEYLTTIATASLIPFEVYELYRRMTVPRLLALVVNIGVVMYLVYRLRHPTAVRRDLR